MMSYSFVDTAWLRLCVRYMLRYKPPHFCYQVIIKCHHQLGICVVWCLSLSLSLCIWLPIQTSKCVISCQAQHQIIWTTSTSASITDFCNPALVSHLGDGQRHNLFCDTLEKLLVQPFLYMIISPKVNVSSLLLAHVTYHVTTGLFHHSLNLH